MSSSNRSSHVEEWIERQAPSEIEVALSVVVPAYNEERRLPPTLVDIIDFLDNRSETYEIIVVDDGSSDGTVEMVRKFERLRPQVRLLRSTANLGKGHAVRMGVMNARGKRIVFADADGSTPIAELARLEEALVSGAEVAIGSRALASRETRVVTRWYRKYLGRMFNLCVNLLIVPDIADTQCGFKLFDGRAARFLFERQRADGFSFDVEILYIAKKADLRIREVPINWSNVPGSKVNLGLDALKMFRDIFVFRVRHRSVTPTDFSESSKQH